MFGFGKDFRVHGDVSRLVYGDRVRFSGVLFNTRSGYITIGDNVVFGHGVMVLTGEHYKTDADVFKTVFDGNDIVIGSNCWIASGVIIIGGVTLGDNIIVGAGSVVTKSFEDGNVFIAGNPAIIKYKLKGKET